MFPSSVHEVVIEQYVGMADEKLCHNGLYTDILQRSQTALLLLQIFASIGEHLIKHETSFNFIHFYCKTQKILFMKLSSWQTFIQASHKA